MRITLQQRYKYRDELIAQGVPDAIAVMASNNLKEILETHKTAEQKILGGFVWMNSPEGLEFWDCVWREANAECK